ncbi:hypothetical protein FC695_07850 [Bacillus cereus]|uniref:Uncharacterized protein n=1 Tax=Bacillus cereus TaxID=1396 RepID=A0A9X9F7L6_BACCE|nr:hypothetical protein FC695_07850 [Bacillus cereus]
MYKTDNPIYAKDLNGNKIMICGASCQESSIYNNVSWVSERRYEDLCKSYRSFCEDNPHILTKPEFFKMIDGVEYLITRNSNI